MKKSRVLVAIVLAIILVVLCVSAPTFSWFSRGHSLSGENMMLTSKNTYTAYNGYNVTMATYPSDDGYTYSTSSTSDFSGSNILYNRRRYFCTTITNSSGSAQNVSLYAKTLSIPTSNNGSLALGVNGPTRSYRDYSSLATTKSYADRDLMRIYFEKDNNVSGWNGTEFYICWKVGSFTDPTMGSDGTYTKLTWVGDNNNGNSNRYYADIPITATHAFFCVENWGTNGRDNNNQPVPNYWQRSQELKNLANDGQNKTQSVKYKITNTNTYGNATATHETVGGSGGACINHYYDSIFVSTGGSFDAALTNTNSSHIPYRSGYNKNFTGTLHYYSSNPSVFTVNENTGVITPQTAGTATLYTKSVGYYTDTQQVETTVTVTSEANYVFYDVPIVRNILVPGTTENDANVVKVYWYVINNSTEASLTYTIDSIYLGM